MPLPRRNLLTLPTLTACTAPFPTVAPNDTTPPVNFEIIAEDVNLDYVE